MAAKLKELQQDPGRWRYDVAAVWEGVTHVTAYVMGRGELCALTFCSVFVLNDQSVWGIGWDLSCQVTPSVGHGNIRKIPI